MWNATCNTVVMACHPALMPPETRDPEDADTTAGARAGSALGWLIGPVFGAVSLLRHARTFHPTGPVYHARVRVDPGTPRELQPLARTLTGRALLRFSGALWKHAESVPDVLGCAIRLRRNEAETPEAASDDQDLLFATIKRPWTMPFSPLTTHVHDYLANDYFAVSPFDAGLSQPVYLRVRPERRDTPADGSRNERLAASVDRGDAVLHVEASDGPSGPWRPLNEIRLERAAEIDGEALRYAPFRDGRGLHPHGFLHALRRGVYAMSQSTRPAGAH